MTVLYSTGLQIVDCTAMAGTELECSLFCGAESGCGAWYVDTSSQPDKL